MAVNSIGRVAETRETSRVNEEQRAEYSRRLELSQQSWFDGGSKADLSGFVSPLDADTKAGIADLYAGVSETDRAKLESAGKQMGAALLSAGGKTATTSSAFKEAETNALVTYVTTTGADKANQVAQGFFYMALSGAESYLRSFANRVNYVNGVNRDLRTEITELRDMLTDWPEGATQTFSWKEVTFDAEGKPTTVSHTNEKLTKEQADSLLDKLEGMQASCSEVKQLAEFDLQKCNQDYSQAVNTLADIQKQMHDDAKAVIANLKS
jgi:hypothetical protein